MTATSLRLMSMNMENLFSPGVNFYGSSYSQGEYDEKMDWIANMIARCQVHVTGLVEMGEDPVSIVQDLFTRIAAIEQANNLTPQGCGPFTHRHMAPTSAGGAQIRTGIISRFPLSNTGNISDFPQGFQVDLYDNQAGQWNTVPYQRFSRPVATATIQPPNGAHAFNLFVIHLKSKRPNTSAHDGYNEPVGIARSAIQRNIEAAALRYHLDTFLVDQYDNQDSDVPTFVVGDFNDVPNSVPLENIRGPFDAVPGPSSPWSGPDKRRLLSCARLHMKFAAYEDKLYSYVHNENFTLIDQVFVTEHLPGRFKRMETYNDHVFRHQDMSSSTQQDQQWKSRVSDHGVVVVEFTRMLRPK